MKKLLTIIVISSLIQTNVIGAIREAQVKVGGMVCTACTTVIKRSLMENIPNIEKVKDIDLETAIVTITFKIDNDLTQEQLTQKLQSTLQKSTYKFDSIKKIIE